MRTWIAMVVLAAGSAAALAQGPGPGMGMDKGMMGGCCSAKDTPAWSMMTPEERKAHQEKMLGFKDMGACSAYMDEHHKQMQARAKDRGMKMPEGQDHGCDRLKSAKS